MEAGGGRMTVRMIVFISGNDNEVTCVSICITIHMTWYSVLIVCLPSKIIKLQLFWQEIIVQSKLFVKLKKASI